MGSTFDSFPGQRVADSLARARVDDDLDELICYVAERANQDEDRPRQKRLDVALDTLSALKRTERS